MPAPVLERCMENLMRHLTRAHADSWNLREASQDPSTRETLSEALSFQEKGIQRARAPLSPYCLSPEEIRSLVQRRLPSMDRGGLLPKDQKPLRVAISPESARFWIQSGEDDLDLMCNALPVVMGVSLQRFPDELTMRVDVARRRQVSTTPAAIRAALTPAQLEVYERLRAEHTEFSSLDHLVDLAQRL